MTSPRPIQVVRRGTSFSFTNVDEIQVLPALPGGVYTATFDAQSGYGISKIDNFSIPHKVYGKAPQYCKRILKTYHDRSKGLGVLLSGKKGSGKTLLVKEVSIEAAKLGIPTIVVTSPFRGTDFNQFIQSINQSAILVFDEFEKVYNKDDQQELLTLLDGVYSSQKLVMLTCNDSWRIDEHMRNRPGRLYYSIDFKEIDQEVVEEYCQDHLQNKKYLSDVKKTVDVYKGFNFDMLVALVEEVNRYDESPIEAVKLLNIKYEEDVSSRYAVRAWENGVEVKYPIDDPELTGNPQLLNWQYTSIYYPEEIEGEEEGDRVEFYFKYGKDTFLRYDPITKSYWYKVIGIKNEGVQRDIEISLTFIPPTPFEFVY